MQAIDLDTELVAFTSQLRNLRRLMTGAFPQRADLDRQLREPFAQRLGRREHRIHRDECLLSLAIDAIGHIDRIILMMGRPLGCR